MVSLCRLSDFLAFIENLWHGVRLVCQWRAFIALAGLLTLATGSCGCAARAKTQQKQHEDRYQTALAQYETALKPGMKRREVESYLRSNGVGFYTSGGVENYSTFSDLIIIGHEKHPWYCSAHNVYIAINFARLESVVTDLRPKDSDTLAAISIEHRLEGCL